MKEISLHNPRLKKILCGITSSIFDNPETVDELTGRCVRKGLKHKLSFLPSFSEEYLFEALKDEIQDWQWPVSSYGLNTGMTSENTSIFYNKKIGNHIKNLSFFGGSSKNALCMFYPSKGYIGWHHNGNCPGYNVLFTYNTSDQGYFKYYNKSTNQFVTLQDAIGWNVRVGYYPDQETHPDKVFWHCAYSDSPRITIAFIFYEHSMWNSLIDDITLGDYKKDDILSQGPQFLNV